MLQPLDAIIVFLGILVILVLGYFLVVEIKKLIQSIKEAKAEKGGIDWSSLVIVLIVVIFSILFFGKARGMEIGDSNPASRKITNQLTISLPR